MARERDPDTMGADQYPPGDAPPVSAMPEQYASMPQDPVSSPDNPPPPAPPPMSREQRAVQGADALPGTLAPRMPASPTDVGIAGMRAADRTADVHAVAADKNLDSAYAQQEAALRNKVAMDATDAKEMAPFHVQEAELAQRYQAQTAAAQASAKQQTTDHLATLQAMQDDFASNDSQKGFWADKGAASTVGWAIALGLGAFAQAASRGQIQTNGAMQMFDRALATDAQDKSRKLAAMREGIAGERGIIGELRQTFGDDKTALQANYVLGLGKIEADIKSMMSKTQDQRVLAQGDQQLAELQQRKAAAVSGLEVALDNGNFQRAHAISGALQTKETLDYQRMVAEYNRHLKEQAAQKGVTARMTVPTFLPSQNDEQGKELSNRFVGYLTAHDQISPLQDLLMPMGADGERRPESSFKNLTPEKVARLNQLAGLLTLTNLEEFHRGAAVSKEEMQLVNDVRGVGLGGELAWNTIAPATVVSLLDKLDKYNKKQVYNYALGSGQATPKLVAQDLLDPANFAAFDWDNYVSSTPRLQKEIKGQ